MRPLSALRLHRPRPPEIEGRAADNLRYIRETMERAGSFTAISGWGIAAVGATALGAAWIASRRATVHEWLSVWLAEALLALAIGLWTTGRKAQAGGGSLFTGPGQRFALSFAAPAAAAAALTASLQGTAFATRLPGVWLLLYGTGIVTGGAFSVRSVPAMGFCFMALGMAALASPVGWGNGYMAAGFGGLHLLFGAWIARRHGG